MTENIPESDKTQPRSILMPMSEIRGYRIVNGDEDLGRIVDLFVEDDSWRPRYVVVDIGNWLVSKKVVLSPAVFGSLDVEERSIEIQLTKEQIKEGPTLDEHETVSAKHRNEVAVYYGWTTGWAAGLGATPTRPMVPVNLDTGNPLDEKTKLKKQKSEDSDEDNLRSFNEIKGYSIEATDDSIGHVEDIIIDPVNWQTRYLVVDTRNWLPGRKVLVAIHWLDSLSYAGQSASLKLTRNQIKESPEYAPGREVEREYEDRIHEHYQLPTYWI